MSKDLIQRIITFAKDLTDLRHKAEFFYIGTVAEVTAVVSHDELMEMAKVANGDIVYTSTDGIFFSKG